MSLPNDTYYNPPSGLPIGSSLDVEPSVSDVGDDPQFDFAKYLDNNMGSGDALVTSEIPAEPVERRPLSAPSYFSSHKPLEGGMSDLAVEFQRDMQLVSQIGSLLADLPDNQARNRVLDLLTGTMASYGLYEVK